MGAALPTEVEAEELAASGARVGGVGDDAGEGLGVQKTLPSAEQPRGAWMRALFLSQKSDTLGAKNAPKVGPFFGPKNGTFLWGGVRKADRFPPPLF